MADGNLTAVIHKKGDLRLVRQRNFVLYSVVLLCFLAQRLQWQELNVQS
jgi:hypothetical protein